MGNVFLTTKCLRIATILVSCSSRAKIGSYSKKTVTSPSFSTVALVLKKSQWIRLSNGYHFFFFSNYSITSRECYGYDSVEHRFTNFPVHAILSPVANIGKRSGRTHKNLKETPFLPRSHHLVGTDPITAQFKYPLLLLYWDYIISLPTTLIHPFYTVWVKAITLIIFPG